MLDCDQRTQMKSPRRSASTWKLIRALWHERLSFIDWLSGFWGKWVSCFFSKQELWGIIISTLKIVWKPECFGSQIKYLFLSWRSQFFNYSKVSVFFSHALPISLNTLTLELSLFQCFVNCIPKQSSVRPWGRHTRVWKGSKAFGSAVHPENFPGPHQCQDAIRQGAQWSIVTRRLRLGACWEGPQRKTLNVIVI